MTTLPGKDKLFPVSLEVSQVIALEKRVAKLEALFKEIRPQKTDDTRGCIYLDVEPLDIESLEKEEDEK